MPELRQDVVSGRWVLIAPDRDRRPNEFRRTAVHRAAACPFCHGHESATPQALAVYPRPAATSLQPTWSVRVVPNLYPAVQAAAGGYAPPQPPPTAPELYPTRAATGVHEVIIESPRHIVGAASQTAEETFWTCMAYRDRLQAARQHPDIRHALIFKNVGADAGASLQHLHSQLVGLPLVPTEFDREWSRALAYYDQHNRTCLFCQLLQTEEKDGSRVVWQSDQFVAYCPFASRFAMEVWLLPRRHCSHFEITSDDTLEDLARAIHDCLTRLELAVPSVSYNMVLHTSPFDTTQQDHYHWHLEILPRISTVAGLEWGTGCHINPVDPLEAAQRLRTARGPAA